MSARVSLFNSECRLQPLKGCSTSMQNTVNTQWPAVLCDRARGTSRQELIGLALQLQCCRDMLPAFVLCECNLHRAKHVRVAVVFCCTDLWLQR
jgi:hypothetical protein